MSMDFGALPPEVNSARIYAGGGAGPMMAAAAAWNGLAAELELTAVQCQAVVVELTGADWLGPTSTAMATAVTPYLRWMDTTAGSAQRAAAQALASAAAYEAAFAMTVPPPAIAANRATLAALVATNVLGQNSAAIAATEALYGEMWSQDAAAMYGYAGSSAAAGALTPLAAPAPVTAGAAAQPGSAGAAAHTELSQLVTGLGSAVHALATPLDTMADGLNSFAGIPVVSNATNGVINTAAWFAMAAIPNAVSLAHTLAGAAPTLAADVEPVGVGAGLGATLAGASAPAVAAEAGRAVRVGALSVPPAWTTTGAAAAVANAGLPEPGWAGGAGEPTTARALPLGMPHSAGSGRGATGFAMPRYGVKPVVMARPVGVG